MTDRSSDPLTWAQQILRVRCARKGHLRIRERELRQQVNEMLRQDIAERFQARPVVKEAAE